MNKVEMRTMPQVEFIRKSNLLQTLLEEATTRLGAATGFVKRQSKLTASKFAMTLILGWLDKPQATLNDLVQVSEDLGVEISESGLHQRMTPEAVAFLEALLQKSINLMNNTAGISDEVLEQFRAVYLIDSSVITLPEVMQASFAGFASQGSEAAMRFQLCFDYLRGNVCALEAGPGRENDQSSTLIERMIAGACLFLFDLGYFNQDTFAKIAEGLAFFVSRYKHGTYLYGNAEDQRPLDLLSILQESPADEYEQICYLGSRQRLKVRLVAQRLPPEVVAQRRRKAREAARKKGHTPPAAYLRLLAWSLYITNTTPAQLSLERMVTFYRVRWQIELIFKVWKSQAKLAQVGDYRPERVLCQLFARLIGLIIFHWMAAPWRVTVDRELSMTKAFNNLQRHITRLLDSIAQGWQTTPAVLARITQAFLKHGLKDKRRTKPSTFQRLTAKEGLT
jgi:hypothetical protein